MSPRNIFDWTINCVPAYVYACNDFGLLPPRCGASKFLEVISWSNVCASYIGMCRPGLAIVQRLLVQQAWMWREEEESAAPCQPRPFSGVLSAMPLGKVPARCLKSLSRKRTRRTWWLCTPSPGARTCAKIHEKDGFFCTAHRDMISQTQFFPVFFYEKFWFVDIADCFDRLFTIVHVVVQCVPG